MDAQVSLEDDAPEDIHGCEYYQIEDGWIVFKDSNHKAMVAYPEKRVTRIKRLDDKPNGHENVIHVQASLDGTRIAHEVARRLDTNAAA